MQGLRSVCRGLRIRVSLVQGETEVVVKLQKPKAPKLEQWSPGIPQQRLKATDPAFTYAGTWETDKDGARTSRQAGNEVTINFTGRAIALLGFLGEDGGRADVYLDGKRVGVADAYIMERTHDSVLWHVYGLKPGAHQVRLVTLDTADPRSKGKRIELQGAVTYR